MVIRLDVRRGALLSKVQVVHSGESVEKDEAICQIFLLISEKSTPAPAAGLFIYPEMNFNFSHQVKKLVVPAYEMPQSLTFCPTIQRPLRLSFYKLTSKPISSGMAYGRAYSSSSPMVNANFAPTLNVD